VGSQQYKKVLELMLDLEKKTDKQFFEQRQTTATAIMRAFDLPTFRREYQEHIEEKFQQIEHKFDREFEERITKTEE